MDLFPPSGKEWKEDTAVGIRHADHVASSIRKKLSLTLPTNGFLSVGIVRSRTQATEFKLFVIRIRDSYFRSWTSAHGLCALYTALQNVGERLGPGRVTKLCSVVVGPTRTFKYGLHRQILPARSRIVFSIFISPCPLQLISKL
jgi:hypothetical protein